MARITISLPAQLLEGIDRFERNRSRFIGAAVAHELERRRREGLLRSLANPHPETSEIAKARLSDWGASHPEDEELVDLAQGLAVSWVEGKGWLSDERIGRRPKGPRLKRLIRPHSTGGRRQP
jgi:hypothetical protein